MPVRGMFDMVADCDVPTKRNPATLPLPLAVPSDTQYAAVVTSEVHEKVTDELVNVEPGCGVTVSGPDSDVPLPNETVTLSSATPPVALVQVSV